MNKTILTSLLIISFFYTHSQCIDGDCNNGNGVYENTMYNYTGFFKNGNLIEGQQSKVVFTKLANGNYSRKEILIFDGLFENGNYKEGIAYNESGVLEYVGPWIVSNDYLVKDGQGKLYYPNGKIQFDGLFENGNYKEGIAYNESGVKEYVGPWIVSNGYLFKNGQGKLYYPNGNMQFEGLFENEYKKQGKLYKRNGNIEFDGLFENGNIKKGISYNESGVKEYDGSWVLSDGYLRRDGKGIDYIDGIGYKTNYKNGIEIVNQYDPNDIQGTSSDFIEINLESPSNGKNELISISIHGLSSIKKYIFDTGAETFDISPTMEKYLKDNKFINNEDYLTPIITTGFTADVKILSRRVRISNIKIGDYVVNNVVATINNSDDDPLLCGRALLQMKFKNVSWSPGKLVLER